MPTTTRNDKPSEITLQFSMLRLVCLAALILMIWRIVQKEYFGSALSFVVLVHHVLMSFGPRFCLPRILDLVLTLGQIGIIASPAVSISMESWGLHKIIFNIMIWWTLFTFLVLFALLKIADILNARGKNLFERYNIGHPTPSQTPDRQVDITHHHHEHRVVRTVKEIFLGKAIWEAQFHDEPKWIIISRGILAGLTIVIVTIVACYTIIFETVHQEFLTPVNDVRSYWLPPDFTPTHDTVWNVVLIRVVTKESLEKTNFSSAVNIKPLWDGGHGPECSWVPYKPTATLASNYGPSIYYESVTFHCPQRVLVAREQFFHLPTAYRDICPDLLVTVNFTMLGISSDSMEDAPTNSVQLLVGLIHDTPTVIGRTSPTTLIPGVNLIGIVNLSVRQTMSNSKFASLGLFDFHQTFYTATIVHVWPDPQASSSSSSSPRITPSSQTATMRLIPQMDFSEWKVVQERRDKSVLRGFSTTGGLWTVLGGMFTLLFGSSILRIVFRVKPLSVFGLVHKGQKNRIREACLKDYPYITRDIHRVPQEQRGLVSFLVDFLISVEHFIVVVDEEEEDGRSIGDGASLRGDTGDRDRVVLRSLLPAIIRPSGTRGEERLESA